MHSDLFQLTRPTISFVVSWTMEWEEVELQGVPACLNTTRASPYDLGEQWLDGCEDRQSHPRQGPTARLVGTGALRPSGYHF